MPMRLSIILLLIMLGALAIRSGHRRRRGIRDLARRYRVRAGRVSSTDALPFPYVAPRVTAPYTHMFPGDV